MTKGADYTKNRHVEHHLQSFIQTFLLRSAFSPTPIWSQQWTVVTLAKCRSGKQLLQPKDMSLAHSFSSPEIFTCKWPGFRVTYMSTKEFGRQDNIPHLASIFFCLNQNWKLCYYLFKWSFVLVYLFWLFVFLKIHLAICFTSHFLAVPL